MTRRQAKAHRETVRRVQRKYLKWVWPQTRGIPFPYKGNALKNVERIVAVMKSLQT